MSRQAEVKYEKRFKIQTKRPVKEHTNLFMLKLERVLCDVKRELKGTTLRKQNQKDQHYLNCVNAERTRVFCRVKIILQMMRYFFVLNYLLNLI